MSDQDTIFALASAAGQAGLAVIRVSGPNAVSSANTLCKIDLTPRHAHFTKVCDPSGELIDEGVCIFFKGPHSFTGEDVIEYTLHGSRAVVSRFLDVLSECDGHRMAEPGEFTKRAFLNGRLDLTAAEAVADLIHAETEAQRMQALDQLGGGLEEIYRNWADRLSKLLAHQEAEIEFPDEDMPDGIDDAVRGQIEGLMQEISAHLDDNRRGERLRTGMQIAIIGAPNAGKSSLLNWLAQRDAAIVSDTAGTTRDIVEVSLNLGGYPVVLCDTAGLRNSTKDHIEQEGIRRAINLAGEADLKIAMFDASEKHDQATLDQIGDNTLVVINKCDLNTVNNPIGFAVSLKSGDGLEQMLGALTDKVRGFFQSGQAGPPLTRERHRQNLKQVLSALARALSADLPELAAEDLRQALLALGRITGRVDVEQLLDIVFKDFCIGK